MGCGDYTNHSNVSGYYVDYVPSSTYQNTTCYNWTNESECTEENYHVNHVPSCYQNVAYSNATNNVHWSNNPGSTPETHYPVFGNTCGWGDFCNFGNTCAWGGNFCDFYDTCDHYNIPAHNDNYCDYYDLWYDLEAYIKGSYCTTTGTWYDHTCSVVYSAYDEHMDGDVHENSQVSFYDNDCYTGYANNCYDPWGDSCYDGYSDDCATDYANACKTGYANSNYGYANHSNYPFNNFCNHSDIFT